MELAAQKAAMGRGAEALQTLAESAQLDEQIGHLPERSFRLAVAAVVHAACGQPALAIAALGAYDAHVPRGTGWWRGPDRIEPLPEQLRLPDRTRCRWRRGRATIAA